jgi:choline dehydrogenase-like flavoprotein
MERLRYFGLLFDTREIQLFFPPMRVRRADGGMILVNGMGLGGTTAISTGNAVRMDKDLQALGINLDAEFAEIYREIPITTAHQERWRPTTRRLFDLCQEMGLAPQPTPKMGDYARCAHCGRCVLGCPLGVKWDSRRFLDVAVERGAHLITDCKVQSVAIEAGRATGVWARQGWAKRFYAADLIILAAGGLATPVILQNSGIPCERSLFVDPVLCVAAHWKDAGQCSEVAMPFIVQREHYILSPYFDYLSFFFNRKWKYPAEAILSIMIKLADTNRGSSVRGMVRKRLTDQDKRWLRDGVVLSKEILKGFGVDERCTFLGTLNAGHPGGMLPLTEREAESFHHCRLPENLYLADATLIPKALGNPPILTIIAISKRVSRLCRQRLMG